jgi:hypothetical protein
MDMILAKKIEELELDELMDVLRKLQTEDRDAFELLQELVEDI